MRAVFGIHFDVIGCVTAPYTVFLRLEKHVDGHADLLVELVVDKFLFDGSHTLLPVRYDVGI